MSATTFDSEEVQKNIFAITGDPNQFNDKFYEHIGNLSDKGMKIGLTRDVAVAEALKVVIQNAYMYDNTNSQGGRTITEDENNRIINLLGALSANVKDTRVLRKGGKLIDDGDVQKGTGYAGFVLKAITDLDKILENAETETDNEAKKNATSQRNIAQKEFILDLNNPDRVDKNGKKTGITTNEEFQKRIELIGEMEFNNYLLFPYWDMSQRFNSRSQEGGVGDLNLTSQAMIDIDSGKVDLGEVFGPNGATYFKTKYKGINNKQNAKLIERAITVSGSREQVKLYTRRFDDHIGRRLIGNPQMYKQQLEFSYDLRNARSELYEKWAIKAGEIEKLHGNKSDAEKAVFYNELIKEMEPEFDNIKQKYFESDLKQTVIDVENLDILPKQFLEVNPKNGIPEFLYASYLFAEHPDAYRKAFEGTDVTEYPNFYRKARERADKRIQADPTLDKNKVLHNEITKDFVVLQGKVLEPNEMEATHVKSYQRWKQNLLQKKNIGTANTVLSFLDTIIKPMTWGMSIEELLTSPKPAFTD